MREIFKNQLVESGYIHHMLKPDFKRTKETQLLNKKILKSKSLWNGESLDTWSVREDDDRMGGIELFENSMRMKSPTRREFDEPMDRYFGYSSLRAQLKIDGENWEGYNRIVCRVRPECNGFHSPFLTINFINDGIKKIPDIYNREGFHVINLENHKWNECVWEFLDMPRDKAIEVSFQLNNHGKELFGEDMSIFDIADIRLEKVENPDVSLGWQGNETTISYSTTGYWDKGSKIAIAQFTDGGFEIIEIDTNKVVFKGELKPMKNDKGSFGIMDFTSFEKKGRYKIKVNNIETFDFLISDNVMEEAVWKSLNYIYGQRCGFPVSGRHSYCHGDIIAKHNDLSVVYNGGWHDAGDVSQQTLQTGETVHSLLTMARKAKEENNTLLYRRLVEEARWGIDFILRTRFGDGYRVWSAGLSRWTNNFLGDNDDHYGRVHNRSFDNFLLAAFQAEAGHLLAEEDYDLSWVLINTAKEDYKFAVDRFNEIGMETQQVMEHTHNASLSQWYAVASFCASNIYLGTNDKYYADEAAKFADLLIKCQDNGEAELDFKGFFYRDESKKAIVHFNHQSRDFIFVQALDLVCRTQKNHEHIGLWEESMLEFGKYLKAIYKYSMPYGMIPAGVHGFDEPEDEETFSLLHVYTTYDKEKDNYINQLKSGIKISDKYCLRHFPIWFSFRGNATVLLATGKAASIVGNYFNDEELIEIARDQIYWTMGKNPFGQSLMYGEGAYYAQQYAALSGENVGEIPVGIQTRENEDTPYWPMANNATYKEQWMSSVGRWLLLVADLY